MLLSLTAFALQSGRTWGRMILPRYSHLPSTLQQNPNAPQLHKPPSFCLIHPEAQWLTFKNI
jgi:hypothetical protein